MPPAAAAEEAPGAPAMGDPVCFPPPHQPATQTNGLEATPDVPMPDAAPAGSEEARGPTPAEDRARRIRLAKDLEHLSGNWGRDSPQAKAAAEALAAFEEQARQRASAARPVGQLLCTAAQQMQAAHHRHQARLAAVRAAQEGLAAAKTRVAEAEQHLRDESAACQAAREEWIEAQTQVSKLEMQLLPAARLPPQQPANYAQLLRDLQDSVAAASRAESGERATIIADMACGVQRLLAATMRGQSTQPAPSAEAENGPTPTMAAPQQPPTSANDHFMDAPTPKRGAALATPDGSPREEAGSSHGEPTSSAGAGRVGSPAEQTTAPDSQAGSDLLAAACNPVSATQLDSPGDSPPSRGRERGRTDVSQAQQSGKTRSRSDKKRTRRKTTPVRPGS